VSANDYQATGFTVVSLLHNGLRSTWARFHCVSCDATSDCRVTTGLPLDCHGYAKKMARRGWQAWANKKSKTYCPACLGPRKKAASPPALKVVPMAPPKLVDVRKPTQAERMKIRALLDLHFDDARGMYLEGKNDQTLAEEVGVPRLVVEQMREVSYGPLRVNPEDVAMQAEITQLRQDLDLLKKELDERLAPRREEIAQLEVRLANIAARLDARIDKVA